MLITVNNLSLSIVELFQKYDLDKITEILEHMKKDIFIRSNEIKKIIGSNPEIMIKCGESVVNIYNSCKKLGIDVNCLIDDINKSLDVIDNHVPNIEVNVPDFNSLINFEEDKEESTYYDSIIYISEKKFMDTFLLYLSLKEDSDNLEVSNYIDDLYTFDTSIAYHYANNLFNSFWASIQYFPVLSEKELAELFIICFCFEKILNNNSLKSNIDSLFHEVIVTRVSSISSQLELISSINGNLDICSTFCQIMNNIYCLMKLFDAVKEIIELNKSNPLLLKFSIQELNNESKEFCKQCVDNLIDEMANSFINMKLYEGKDKNYSNKSDYSYKYRLLCDIYIALYNLKIPEVYDILQKKFFPTIIDEIKLYLSNFICKGPLDEIISIVRIKGNIKFNIPSTKQYNNNIKDWIYRFNEHIEDITNEFKYIENLIECTSEISIYNRLYYPINQSNIQIDTFIDTSSPEVLPTHKFDKILDYISELFLTTIMNKLLNSISTIIWSIRGKLSQNIASFEIDSNDYKSMELFNIHSFVNLLSQGKKSDEIELLLFEYAGTDQKNSLILDTSIVSENICWRSLATIIHEIASAISTSEQSSLNSLNYLVKKYTEVKFRRFQADKLYILEALFYAIYMHLDKIMSSTCKIQGIILDILNYLDTNFEDSCPIQILSYCQLYRQLGISGYPESPYTILTQLSADLIAFNMDILSQEQNIIYSLVCQTYLQSYIIPILYKILNKTISFISNRNNLDNGVYEKKSMNIDILINKLCIAIYCDLYWCYNFMQSEYEGISNSITSFNLIDKKVLESIFEDKNRLFNILSEKVLSKQTLMELEEAIKIWEFDIKDISNLNNQTKLLPIDLLFVKSGQRFPTLPISPPKLGLLSTKINIASDKASKIFPETLSNINQDFIFGNIDTQKVDFIEGDNKSNSTNNIQDDSVNKLEKNEDHMVDYPSSATQIFSEKLSGWFSMVGSQDNSIDKQKIWQVSNLLKDTVKDKVFGSISNE
ncbi:uncharacterized protein CMU_015780 [Cryptosporidium muris RN66]|uniref:Uncharacterized protein n=1 Tax=Cryptosporidium muris (strain RN66) TaxID=441375 RepID=B6ACH7_CRYMR|nr:uncharacterized protein CMU_015780 [Cryptosporidium muris RN66]EEA05831.1 hypothetical protein, conserved [Cryptosporidium muris RN66]|eukprot:XP_002140180.1 hypothetical protein [Cryptosporidium muris RN66]